MQMPVRTQPATRLGTLNMRRPTLICILTIFAPAAAAQVFECTDANGVRQYAQFCPPGTVQQRQVSRGGEGSGETGAAGPAPKSINAQELEFRKRLLERQDAETKATQEQARAEEFERNCVEARTQLQAAEEGQRLQTFDPATGERVQMGDEERAAEVERQRKSIAQWCK
jgi:hypothetical protein